MRVHLLIRSTAADEVIDRVINSVDSSGSSDTEAIVRFRHGGIKIVDVSLSVSDTQRGQENWATIMTATQSAYASFLDAHPDARSLCRDEEESWWPAVFVRDPQVDGAPNFARFDPHAAFALGWDGGVIETANDTTGQQLLALAAQSLAQWTAVTSAIEAARAVLAAETVERTRESVHTDELRLRSARRQLIEAVVQLGPRLGLFYEYEVEFVRALRTAWHLDDQIDLAERSLSAVEGMISVEAAALARASNTRQEALAKSATFWLFVVTVVSGFAVILSAVDFVSSRVGPSVGNLARLGILVFCVVVTAVISIRCRHLNLPDE